MSEIKFEKTDLEGVWIRKIIPNTDNRGSFVELWKSKILDGVIDFKQVSLSKSTRNVIRGLHAQQDQWQLITLIEGEAIDIQLDLTPGSPTFGQLQQINLSDEGFNQLLLYPGVFHGYKTLSALTQIIYQSNLFYRESPEFGVNISSIKDLKYLLSSDYVMSIRDSEFKSISYFTSKEQKLELVTLKMIELVNSMRILLNNADK